MVTSSVYLEFVCIWNVLFPVVFNLQQWQNRTRCIFFFRIKNKKSSRTMFLYSQGRGSCFWVPWVFRRPLIHYTLFVPLFPWSKSHHACNWSLPSLLINPALLEARSTYRLVPGLWVFLYLLLHSEFQNSSQRKSLFLFFLYNMHAYLFFTTYSHTHTSGCRGLVSSWDLSFLRPRPPLYFETGLELTD